MGGRGFSVGGRALPGIALAIPLFAMLGSWVVPPQHEARRGLQTTNETVTPPMNETVTPVPTMSPVKVEFLDDEAQLLALIINFGSIAFVMYLLHLLLKMAHIQIEELPEYQLVHEEFQDRDNGQNWNWDFVLVTQVKGEDYGTLTDFQQRYTMRRIVEALHDANLETCQFKSQDWKKIIIKIRASSKRLRDQADVLNMRLRLDEKEVKKRLADGLPDENGDWLVYPRKDGWTYQGQTMYTAIRDTEKQCSFQYYEYMYGEYDAHERFQALYKKYPLTSSIFRSVDRIKLILSILRFPTSERGAGLALEKLIRAKVIDAAFPLHDMSELRAVQRKWLVYWRWPWNQPFNRIKDYFGEKIAMYFLFLGHYTAAVMIAAVVGLVFYLITVVSADPNSPAIPFFCVFMALWATLFVEFWKRKQSTFAMMWGMTDTEKTAEERPEFAENTEVESITSPIDGLPEKYFPPSSKAKRVLFSWVVIATCSLGVLWVVIAIFILKARLTITSNFLGSRKSFRDANLHRNKPVRNWGVLRSWNLVDFSTQVPGIVVSLINALQIFALEPVFSSLARWLTNYECHKTDTQFEDSLTGKVFIFQFINSFTSYLYIAFFKEYQSQQVELQYGKGYYACVNSCMDELRTQLGSIFISKVIIANFKDIFLPYSEWNLKYLAKKEKEQEVEVADEEATSATLRQLSPAEEQLQLEEYDWLLGPFGDYRDLVIIYGYTVLFVAAFPLAPAMALVNSYVQIRSDAYHISVKCRRPWPSNAEDIGTWASIIELTSYFAVIVNSLIIVYTGTFLNDFSLSDRLLVFLGLYHGLFFVKYATALLVDDVPKEVDIQSQRQTFVTNKLLKLQQDDVIQIDDNITQRQSNSIPDVAIHDKDDDVVYLDYPGYHDFHIKQAALEDEYKHQNRQLAKRES